MLKDQIIQDMTAAMKSKDPSLETLRMLKADIMKYEVSGKDMVATDDVVLDICKRSIKQRKEAAEGFKMGGKNDLAEKELSEIAVFEKYMPEQMSEDEVKKIVSETITQMNATPADFGKVMGAVMGKCKGKADGNIVSNAVKELLS
ncbi:GatB/YqeY domain-containing protein [Patescibacteria group bacterium]|nr:GatB/YqeY domain-containing protein [Patescibacteria group bacterium]